MSKVRSSELDTGLSSSGGPIEGDTAVSTLVKLGLFMLSTKSVGWTLIQWPGLEIGSNSLHGSGFVGLVLRIGLAISSQVKCASTRLLSPLDLGYPSILW